MLEAPEAIYTLLSAVKVMHLKKNILYGLTVEEDMMKESK